MPTTAEIFSLAWQRHQAGGYAEAEQLYRQILRAEPTHADAWCFLGALQQGQGKFAESESSLRRAVELWPDHPSAPNCLGISLAQLGKLDEAASIFRNLLAKNANDPEVLSNYGLVLYKQGRWDDAIPYYRRAIELQPGFADAHNNLANSLTEQKKLQEALFHYDQTIRFKPNFAEAYFNRATPRLLQGDFLGGWSDYEWRWRRPAYPPPSFRQPVWDGSALNGKTILLWSEQGLGDTLQFIRYAPLVKQRGGKVVAACQAPLVPLLKTCAGIDLLLAKNETPLPDFDVYAPLMSLPAICKTTLATVPASVPYLHADRTLVEQWRVASDEWRAKVKSGANHRSLLVGIAWQGNPTYRKDHQRSIPLACFEPLTRVPGVQLISLQKSAGSEQMAAVKERWPIVDCTARLDEDSGAFQDTAALMRNLDVVVVSDSAVAHLAGALGVPIWLALPWLPDFRWFLDRDDCPWYPTMRVFRQTTSGRWDDVFERIVDAVISEL